jgi:hypothetical protein
MWPALGDESVVKIIILDDSTAANRTAQSWVIETHAEIGAGVWMLWRDGSCSDDGRVGHAAVSKQRNQ